MTVHGAKGLEADVVFLVDTGAAPTHPNFDPKMLSLADDRDGRAGADRLGAERAGDAGDRRGGGSRNCARRTGTNTAAFSMSR